MVPFAEYGLIAAGISLAIIAIVNGLGTNLNNHHLDQHLAEVSLGKARPPKTLGGRSGDPPDKKKGPLE